MQTSHPRLVRAPRRQWTIRTAAVSLLIAALTANGLRLVCVEAAKADKAGAIASTVNADECEKMCAYQGATDGSEAAATNADARGGAGAPTTCLLATIDDATCVAVFAFAQTMPVAPIDLQTAPASHAVASDDPSLHRGPVLTVLTPPPRG